MPKFTGHKGTGQTICPDNRWGDVPGRDEKRRQELEEELKNRYKPDESTETKY